MQILPFFYISKYDKMYFEFVEKYCLIIDKERLYGKA